MLAASAGSCLKAFSLHRMLSPVSYISRGSPRSSSHGTSHFGHDLRPTPSKAACSAGSAILPDKMGKQRRVLLSAQSITVPSGATGCNGARTRSKTARRVSAFVYRWASLARADSPVNFGGTGSNARSRIGILAGLFLVHETILPIVMYTGQAFSSREKLVRCFLSDNP